MKNIKSTKVDGLTIVNCTPHSINLEDRNGNLHSVEKSGITLKANPVERRVFANTDYELVTTEFSPSEEGIQELSEIREQLPNAIIIGSIISAKAYSGDVCSLIPIPGYERVSPKEKRFFAFKFNVFND